MEALEAKRLRRRLQRADVIEVSEARRLVRDAVRRWGAPSLADTAELLTSELVTNALVHTDQEAELTAALSGDYRCRLRVEVHDLAARRPRLRAAAEFASSGRGLLLVHALADAWGVCTHGSGKTIWFELSCSPG